MNLNTISLPTKARPIKEENARPESISAQQWNLI
jgi:hypothetical protein